MAVATPVTIAAIATPPGKGGVGIIRISGDKSLTIGQKLTNRTLTPRQAHFCTFKDRQQKAIDSGLALYFKAPHSYTGEDVVEIHAHGSAVVLHQLLREIFSLGARPAQAGEFSLRAYLNGKIDLIQAEAVADLISAQSETAAQQAQRSLIGKFSEYIHAMVAEVIQLRVLIEAHLDFPEEGITSTTNKQIVQQLHVLLQQIAQIKATAAQGKLLQEGIRIVMAGLPNAGKSTLLNCLCGEEVAIVSEHPGTTRDVLREHWLLDGIPVHLIDTAGIRESDHVVEKEGIARAKKEIAQADVVLMVYDASEPYPETFFEQFSATGINPEKIILVKNKIDLLANNTAMDHSIAISAKHHQGIEALKEKIKHVIGFNPQSEGVFSARTRHLEALTQAQQYLQAAQRLTEEQHSLEIIAEELRSAQNVLNSITGEFTSDDLLGKIFSTFCIGK